MKLIRITTCGECPYFGDGFCTRLRRFVSIDIVNPDCRLENGECEWTRIIDFPYDDYEAQCGATFDYKLGEYCSCCGGKIKIKEVGDE